MTPALTRNEMKHLLTKLKLAFPFLHKRSANEEDYYTFCRQHRIETVFTDLTSDGIWVLFEGKNFIFLNEKLSGWLLRYVMFHEIAHFLFHYPSQSNYGAEFFSVHGKRKNHHEAETVAALLLLPPPELHLALTDKEVVYSEEIKNLIAFRLTLADRYKI